MRAELEREPPDVLELRVGVGREAVHRHDRRDAEFLRDRDVTREVGGAAVEIAASVVAERLHRRDEHDRARLQSAEPADDVEELLHAHVRREPALGDDELAELERRPGRDERAVAVCDVRERAAVDEGGLPLDRLHEVRLQRLAQDHRHRPGRPDLLGSHRHPLGGAADRDRAEPAAEVGEIARHGDDRHRLRGGGDVEAGLARVAVHSAAEADDDVAQGPVVDVEASPPGDGKRVDAGLVPVQEMRLDQRREQVVRRRDRVQVAREVQVQLLHRHHLRVAAARGAALDAEHRPERGFAQAEDRAPPDARKPLRERDRSRRLALAPRRRRDRGDRDQLAVGFRREAVEHREADLGLRAAVQLELVGLDPELRGDVDDRPQRGRLRDLEARRHRAIVAHRRACTAAHPTGMTRHAGDAWMIGHRHGNCEMGRMRERRAGDRAGAPADPGPELGGRHDVRRKDPDTRFPADRAAAAAGGAPNVLIILIDDAGFGSSSAFGGPCNTPSFDRLAADGLKYTRFHTTALCSPTRAALLSGRNHHSVGMGGITEIATSAPGYSSVRPKNKAPLAELLKLNGYSTAHFGKCHEVPVWETSPLGPFDRWPSPGNGFEHFYGFIGGETNQYAPAIYRDTVPVEPDRTPEEGYHFTEDMTDRAIEWVGQQKALMPDKPFFVYYAPGATHAPHHVPTEWSDKYKGAFDDGWDALRERTFARQQELGVIPADAELTARPEEIPAWDEMPDDLKPVLARQMEVYAGFMEHTDHHVGRLLDALEELEVLDDTLVYCIIGDNGASAEGDLHGMLQRAAST